MRRTRKSIKKYVESSDEEETYEQESRSTTMKGKRVKISVEICGSSSSESDIETYLQSADKIDLNSPFFDVRGKGESSFENIEKDIFRGITRLTDSEEEIDDHADEKESSIIVASLASSVEGTCEPKEVKNNSRLIFQQLDNYTKKLEDAKTHIAKYNEKKQLQHNDIDISNLLAAGESKLLLPFTEDHPSLRSSEFESLSESENEDWEEIKTKDLQELKKNTIVPTDNLQITVELPQTMRKKKGDNLLDAVKRRLNRVKKENQILIHKVHLLCWIAHGNYVNSLLNNEINLALGLSLLPSEKSYPDGRPDLKYLEQILKWFRQTMKNIEKVPPKSKTLDQLLELQMKKKEVFNNKMLVFIFVIVLRSLGIHCRLVFSFQVEPLRPPNSELHSLSTKALEAQKEIASQKSGTSSSTPIKKMNKSVIKNVTKAESSNSQNKSTVKNDGPSKKVTTKSNVTQPKKEKNEVKVKESKMQGKHKEVLVKNESDQLSTSQKDKPQRRSMRCSKKDVMKITVDDNKDPKKEKSSRRNKVSNSKETNSLAVENGKSLSRQRTKSMSPSIKIKIEGTKSRSKSTSENLNKKAEIVKVKLPARKRNTIQVPQLDGNGDSDSDLNLESFYSANCSTDRGKRLEQVSDTLIRLGLDGCFHPAECSTDMLKQFEQRSNMLVRLGLDGCSDDQPTSKPNLKKLQMKKQETCQSRRHSKQPKYSELDTDSDECFETKTPLKNKNCKSRTRNKTVSLSRLADVKTTSFSIGQTPISQKTVANIAKASQNRKPIQKDVEGSKYFPSSKQLNVKNDIVQLLKGRISEQKQLDKQRTTRKRKSTTKEESGDSDYVPEAIKKKNHDSDDEFIQKTKVKKRVQIKKNDRKVLSSESEESKPQVLKQKKKGIDIWAEVFLDTEEKWISVDVVRGQIHCVHELFSRATHPVSYVVAWDNANCLKDITRRYCQNFNTTTRKLRIDQEWWVQSMKSFLGVNNARNKEEDDELNREQLEKPLPTSIAEYKNHPLYALKRHLLKFEALYPEDARTLGFVRKEPVYSRDCVHVCHSRDIWLKQAKVVKLGEKPYKIVKARPKYDKLSNTVITDQLLEIFGPWQVEDYTPPTAENGVVPRNAFGNVDLFKPSMLPKKTVHLKLPGLNKITRRMNIDCASAIVGFDFHGGWSHPVYDGFVVCEEFEDQLIMAWELEQEEIEKREQEKYEKRVYGNWKKLIKGLLIRERLKRKYDFGETSTATETKGKSAATGGKEKKIVKGARFSTKKHRLQSDSSDSDY